MFEGIVIRACMVAGIPVIVGGIWAEILDMLNVWKEEQEGWKR